MIEEEKHAFRCDSIIRNIIFAEPHICKYLRDFINHFLYKTLTITKTKMKCVAITGSNWWGQSFWWGQSDWWGQSFLRPTFTIKCVSALSPFHSQIMDSFLSPFLCFSCVWRGWVEHLVFMLAFSVTRLQICQQDVFYLEIAKLLLLSNCSRWIWQKMAFCIALAVGWEDASLWVPGSEYNSWGSQQTFLYGACSSCYRNTSGGALQAKK